MAAYVRSRLWCGANSVTAAATGVHAYVLSDITRLSEPQLEWVVTGEHDSTSRCYSLDLAVAFVLHRVLVARRGALVPYGGGTWLTKRLHNGLLHASCFVLAHIGLMELPHCHAVIRLQQPRSADGAGAVADPVTRASHVRGQRHQHCRCLVGSIWALA